MVGVIYETTQPPWVGEETSLEDHLKKGAKSKIIYKKEQKMSKIFFTKISHYLYKGKKTILAPPSPAAQLDKVLRTGPHLSLIICCNPGLAAGF